MCRSRAFGEPDAARPFGLLSVWVGAGAGDGLVTLEVARMVETMARPDLPQSTPARVTVRVLGRGEEVLALRDEWADLLLHSSAPNVFLSWEWMTTWLQMQGPRVRPHVLLLRRADDETLVGLAPLYRRTARHPFRLRAAGLMGTGLGADHMVFLSRESTESEVDTVLLRHLFSGDHWDILELPRLAEGFAERAGNLLVEQQANLRSSSAVADICPYIPLPGTWDAYLRTMHQRGELNRRWRRLQEKGQAVIHRVRAFKELEEGWEALLRLHQLRRKAVAKGRSAFVRPDVQVFHKRFARLALERA